jgi:uncharacterized protein
MPTVTQHAPGTFCWPELMTSDQNAAKQFYAAVFGWKINDLDLGKDGVYTIFELDGKDVAAAFTLQPEQRAQGMPPYWGSFVSVANVDESAKRAVSLGGKLMLEPFDVMDKGRMAVVLDPIGATFSLWQAKAHAGVSMLGEPGSLGWSQLNASDPAKAKPFYTGLFGWAFRDDAMGDGSTYTTWLKSDGMAGGMMPLPMPGIPSHWLTYFAVANVDETHAKATSLGAITYVSPTDIPGMGRFSVLGDPQGAGFALVRFAN